MAAALLRRVLPSPSPSPALPAASAHRLFSAFATTVVLSFDENRRRFLNRLVYRSKQRGFLELDLVLGSWVEQHVHSMDEANICALLQVLDLVISPAYGRPIPILCIQDHLLPQRLKD